jgi:hypothetical protein
MKAEVLVMRSEGVNGVESGSSGADPLAVGVGHGESDGGGGDAAHALGALELPVVELGLLGAGGREHDGVPGGDPGRVPHRQPQMVPRFPKHCVQVSLPLFMFMFLFVPPESVFSTALHLRLSQESVGKFRDRLGGSASSED